VDSKKEILNEPVAFLAQVAFPRRCASQSVGDARVLSHFRRLLNSTLCSSTKVSNSIAVPVLSLRSTGIPENAQAPLAKSSIRSKTARFIYRILNYGNT
jgi:hypothetical protein